MRDIACHRITVAKLQLSVILEPEYNMLDFDHGTMHVVKAGVNYRFNFFDPRRH